MSDRAAVVAAFLAGSDWAKARRAPLAGDASNRRYERLDGGPGGASAVLMDADPARGEDVRPFLAVAGWLVAQGLSAPRLLDADPAQGLLILEDLGDDLYARLLARDPGREIELYSAATDLLAVLSQQSPPEFVTPYGPELVAKAATAFDWYQRGATGALSEPGRDAFVVAMNALLALVPPRPDVLILRDYHAENLLWLPQRQGLARVGLLDFQDARACHPVYDLVSLLEDVRRDVAPATVAAMRARFRQHLGMAAEEFSLAAAFFALQRNLGILGIFARLAMHSGKPGYVALMPRLWRLIEADLKHPALADIAAILHRELPAPEPAVLDRLRAPCQSRR